MSPSRHQIIQTIFFTLVGTMTFAPTAHAVAGDCLSVEVGGASQRLESLIIPKVNAPAGAKVPTSIVVQAKKDDGKYIVTPFACLRESDQITCIQPDGAGDFFLTEDRGTIYFESDYLNFALGAISGLPPRKDSDPINEDYAIILEDSGDEDTHPTRVKIKTETAQCPAALKSAPIK